MECLAHLCTHSNMARKTAGINRHSCTHIYTLTYVILSRHTQNTPIFDDRLFSGMAHTQASTSSNSAPRKVLVDPTHIKNASNRRIIIQEHLTMRRNKYDPGYRMIQVFRDSERLHIADPASPACMNWITNLALAL